MVSRGVYILFFLLSVYSSLRAEALIENDSLGLEIEKLNREAYDLRNDDLDSAFKMNTVALNNSKDHCSDKVISDILSVRGVLYKNRGNYDSSAIFHLRALKIREGLGLKGKVSNSCNNLGVLYYEINQYQLAEYYYRKSMLLKEFERDSIGMKVAYNNLGSFFYETGQLDSAQFYYEKGITIENDDYLTTLMLKLNLGILRRHLGERKASLNILLPLLEEDLTPEDRLRCLHNISIAYEGLGEYDLAHSYLALSEKLAEDFGGLEIKRDLARSKLIQLLKTEGGNSKRLRYFFSYESLNDSFNLAIINNEADEAEAKYQIEKKDAEIAFEKEKNKRIEAENKQTRTENKVNRIIITVLIILILVLGVLGIFASRLFRQKRKLNQLELEAKRREVEQLMQGYELDMFEAQVSGQHEERRRIAEELHDRLGGLLAAINLQIESINDSETDDQLIQVKKMIHEGMDEVRSVSHNLHAKSLEKHGLKGSLEAICSSISQSKSLKIDLYLEGLPTNLKSEMEREVYKILMELLSNSLKHSGADLITVQINEIQKELNITFEDNGKGFLAEKVSEKGLGMQNINKRVKRLKGNWNIDSHLNHGATIIINIPIA